jgi:hypothetical protein
MIALWWSQRLPTFDARDMAPWNHSAATLLGIAHRDFQSDILICRHAALPAAHFASCPHLQKNPLKSTTATFGANAGCEAT